MKTYKELEREAYMAGNTELAKLYADADDVEHNEDLQEKIDYLSNIIDDVASLVRNA